MYQYVNEYANNIMKRVNLNICWST